MIYLIIRNMQLLLYVLTISINYLRCIFIVIDVSTVHLYLHCTKTNKSLWWNSFLMHMELLKYVMKGEIQTGGNEKTCFKVQHYENIPICTSIIIDYTFAFYFIIVKLCLKNPRKFKKNCIRSSDVSIPYAYFIYIVFPSRLKCFVLTWII